MLSQTIRPHGVQRREPSCFWAVQLYAPGLSASLPASFSPCTSHCCRVRAPPPKPFCPTVLRQPDGQRYFMHQALLVPLAVVFLKSPHTKTYEFCR